MKTIVTIAALILCINSYAYKSPKSIIQKDPVFIGASGIFNTQSQAFGYALTSTIPLNEIMNSGITFNYFPDFTEKSDLNERGIETFGQIKVFRPIANHSLYLVGGYNFTTWKSYSYDRGDVLTEKWLKSESFVLGLNYQIRFASYGYISLEHKFYTEYKTQISSVGLMIPISFRKRNEEVKGYYHNSARSGKSFNKKKKYNLRLKKRSIGN